jgi:signal transduction histidine kinase
MEIKEESSETRHSIDPLQAALLRNINHEIRNPLNIIVGNAELLLGKNVTGDIEVEKSLHAILRASGSLEKTLRSMLDLSSLEAGAFQIVKRPVQLARLIRLQVAGIETMAEVKSLRLVCEIDEPEAVVVIDKYCLKQSLANLLDNAIKFTARGRITVRAYRDSAGSLCVDVADTGIGISPTYLSKLFEPFSQEDMEMTRRHSGLGLGLALVQRYLALNGARLIATSDIRRGSTFTINFANSLPL